MRPRKLAVAVAAVVVAVVVVTIAGPCGAEQLHPMQPVVIKLSNLVTLKMKPNPSRGRS